MLQPINKHTVLKTVRENGSMNVWIAPSKINPAHITKGWHIGHEIKIVSVEDEGEKVPHVFYDNAEGFKMACELDEYLSNYAQWNCNTELGKRIRFWEEL